MPTENTNGHNGHEDESIDCETNWETVAKSALAQLFFRRKRDLQVSLGTIETRLMGMTEDDLSAEDIEQFREGFYALQRLVEEEIVPVVEGVESYEDATINLTAGQKAEALDLRWEDVRALPRKSDRENAEDSEGTDADE